MSEYLYNAIIYKSTIDVIGVDLTQNALDKTDFETNNKLNCVLISEMNLASTTFVIELTYTDFKVHVPNDFLWTDVKYIEKINKYELFLLTPNPL